MGRCLAWCGYITSQTDDTGVDGDNNSIDDDDDRGEVAGIVDGSARGILPVANTFLHHVHLDIQHPLTPFCASNNLLMTAKPRLLWK
jgi:hypothetical protein